jgi:dihydropteroate synthase
VLPVIEALVAELELPVSVDTSKPEVMEAALAAGASMVNDVMALRAPGALEIVASSGAAVCLMHMQGQPRSMQLEPRYRDVVQDVHHFLSERVAACEAAGMDRSRLVIDPGFGFGKTLEHNLCLLSALDEFTREGLPVLAGLSRKSMIGQITGRPMAERLAGSVALAALAVERGASIVRAHDVAATLDAVKIAAAIRRRQRPEGHDT